MRSLDWQIDFMLSGEAGETKSVEVRPQCSFKTAKLLPEQPNDRCICNRLEARVVGVRVDGAVQDVPVLRLRDLLADRSLPLELPWAHSTIEFDIHFETAGTVDLELLGQAVV